MRPLWGGAVTHYEGRGEVRFGKGPQADLVVRCHWSGTSFHDTTYGLAFLFVIRPEGDAMINDDTVVACIAVVSVIVTVVVFVSFIAIAARIVGLC